MRSTTRRQFTTFASLALGGGVGSIGMSACSKDADDHADAGGYEAVAAQTWRMHGLAESPTGAVTGGASASPRGEVMRELVRLATLAPSSHNTQCWKFALQDKAITILPDLSRRCPAVDPDDHHLFVSLGCATENLVHAALAQGLMAEPRFDAAQNTVSVPLLNTPAKASALARAITMRQCTRGDYDGKALSNEELRLLERAGTASGVRVLLLTERSAMERALDYVVQSNTAQMADAAFVKELKTWIRFNGTDAVRTRDGLFSLASGNPSLPAWVGNLGFDWFFTPKSENEKYARQIRSSAGLAIFVGQVADKAHWVEVGRCYERFALQATDLGIRNAFLNQPVEVAATRSPFADAIGLAGQRPDLVVRFGRGPLMPRSLRRPVGQVLV
jgi:hypothetical protein